MVVVDIMLCRLATVSVITVSASAMGLWYCMLW